jgi:hypothetical protein
MGSAWGETPSSRGSTYPGRSRGLAGVVSVVAEENGKCPRGARAHLAGEDGGGWGEDRGALKKK